VGEKGLERYREGGGAGTAGVPSLSAAKFFSSPPVPFKVRSAEIFFFGALRVGEPFVFYLLLSNLQKVGIWRWQFVVDTSSPPISDFE
jgi:hypothetical protein